MAKSTYAYIVKHDDGIDKDAECKAAITAIKIVAPAAGYRQVTDQLHEDGKRINHKKVLRIMKELGILSTAYEHQGRKYSSYRGNIGKIAKNKLNRHFYTDRPYQKLTTDVTEVRWGAKTKNERGYFTCIYDMFSGEILGYEIAMKPTVKFTLSALTKAITKIPSNLGYRTLVHSDQGFQYQTKQWQNNLKDNSMIQSMSRKATCLDNAVMESFFHLLKSEAYYHKIINTFEDVCDAISLWIEYYNNRRSKTKLGGKSPVKYRLLATQQTI